jgi:hypothetical protein
VNVQAEPVRAACECVRGRGVAVVGEFGEITGGHDAKPADLGQGVQLGVAQLVGLVAIHVARAAGSSEDQAGPAIGGVEAGVCRQRLLALPGSR